MTTQFTEEQAIEFYDSKKWELMSPRELAEFQIDQDLMCVPFSKFHAAMETALDRSVWTHEFANRVRLRDELMGKRPQATLSDVFGSLAEVMGNKPIVVIATEGD